MTPARDREALDQAIARGSELLKQGKLDQAQRAFRQALDIDDRNPKVLALLGLSHFRASEFAAARPIYEDLVELAPTDASHRLNLGLVYLKLNDAERAITSLEASRALDPSQGRAVSYLGLAYARAGRYAEAYRSFLIAGQNELASEIEVNLTPSERDGIHAQLGRPVVARTQTPATPARAQTPPAGVPVTPRVPTPPVGVPIAPRAPSGPVTETPPAGIPVTPRAKTGEGAARAMTPPAGVPVRATTPPAGVPMRAETPPTGVPRKAPTPPTGTPAIPSGVSLFAEPPTTSPSELASRSIAEPRTRPPTAPPGSKARTKTSQSDLGTNAAAAVEIAKSEGSKEIASPGFAGARSTPAGSAEIERPSDLDIVSIQPAAQLTDSQQFVLHRAHEGMVPQPVDGRSMVSMAVAAAAPSPAAAGQTVAGGMPPRPLSQIATEDLIRPDDGSDPFEIAANGALLVRVTERVLARLEGVHITGGDLAYELAMRRSRGHQTDEPFETAGSRFHVISGKGFLLAVPPKRHAFTAVALDDDILYLREDLVYAFEASLRWENGNVPGLRGRLHVVQFRGDGAIALLLSRPLVRVKLPPAGLLFVDADRLAGWIGRVIPRAVVPPSGGPMGAMCIECTGEGIVLVEPAPDAEATMDRRAAVAPVSAAVEEARSEPTQPAAVEPEVADFAADLAAHAAEHDSGEAHAGRDEI